MIRQHFGITFHPASLRRLLRDRSHTPQRSAKKARQRNDEAIAGAAQSSPPKSKITLHLCTNGITKEKMLIADFKDKAHLAERLLAFVKEWNEQAHPFQWTKKSVAKIISKCEIAMSEPPVAIAA